MDFALGTGGRVYVSNYSWYFGIKAERFKVVVRVLPYACVSHLL